ncbi:transposase [Acinetobacter baumannii]
MNTKEFVKELINTISDEYIDTYKQIYSSTLIDNKIKEDPYWFDALTFYQSLSQKDKETLFKIIKQTTIDTTSIILGIIDGPVSLNQIPGDFTLTYTENEKTVILNGDLQDEFLTKIKEREQITMIYKEL